MHVCTVYVFVYVLTCVSMHMCVCRYVCMRAIVCFKFITELLTNSFLHTWYQYNVIQRVWFKSHFYSFNHGQSEDYLL